MYYLEIIYWINTIWWYTIISSKLIIVWIQLDGRIHGIERKEVIKG